MQQAQPSQLGQQQSTYQAPQSHQGEQPQLPQFQQPIGTPKPTEKQLMVELRNTVADKWHDIGTFLEISGDQLNIIADRHRGDPQKCLMAMLSGWLHQTNQPASWTDIAEAVEFTGRPDIAQQIRQKYCMQPQPAGQVYNQSTMYSAPQPAPQTHPYAQTQGQPFLPPQFSASTTYYPQLQQPWQQGYGMPQQNVSMQVPQQMQPTAQPHLPPGMYAQQFYFQPVAQVPMQQQQQAGNYPIPQYQNMPNPQQPFAGSAQAGHLPQQPPQSQPQQVSLPPQSSTSQTSQPDGASQDHTSAKRSGTQTPEYQKLREKFDTLIHHLGAILSSEDLADKLFAKKLITSGKQEEASLSAVPNSKKIRVLIIAVLAKVQFDAANYEKFVTVLSNISGAEHMAEFLKL